MFPVASLDVWGLGGPSSVNRPLRVLFPVGPALFPPQQQPSSPGDGACPSLCTSRWPVYSVPAAVAVCRALRPLQTLSIPDCCGDFGGSQLAIQRAQESPRSWEVQFLEDTGKIGFKEAIGS